jgi:hypothetical protein
MRFVSNMKALTTKTTRKTGILSVEELLDSEKKIIISAQIELKGQSNFRQLVKNLGLKTEEGILRYQGRLLNSDLDIDSKKTIILPRNHHLTRLIVEEGHRKVHHGCVKATLAEVRSKFWVPKGRQYVKKLLSKCTVCKKLTGKPYKAPEAAALPARISRSVDFAGPLYVKQGKSMRKVYIALFSCCVTRALHLELVEDMFAQTFRRCLRRFTAARGNPSL